MFEINDLKVIYPKTRHMDAYTAIDGLSLRIEEGEFLVIVGQSGCGKTTLLRAIAGLLPCEGMMEKNGRDFASLSPGDRNLAYVNQNYALYPHLTIFDNIAFPLKSKGAGKKEIIEAVEDVSMSLGIGHLMTRKPKDISGGQQQMVALARAMVKKPAIYLFDEPLSNISQDSREKHRRLIKESVKSRNATAIYVTHDLKEATSLGDRIAVMDKGKIIYIGTPFEIMSSNAIEVRRLFDTLI